MSETKTAIADTLEDLTAEWYTSALRESSTIGADATVTGAESDWIGTGQLGSVARTQLTYEGAEPSAPPSLVVKLPSVDEGSRQMGVAMMVYEAEVRFFEEIASLVDMAIPRMHWGGLEPGTGRFTLVLEDLAPFAEVGDAVAGGTPDQAAAAIEQLPGLQAPCWDGRGLESHGWLTDPTRTQMLFGAVGPLLDTFLERFEDRIDPERIELVKELAPKAETAMERIWQPPLVVAHGDYRLDNMMFGTTPDAPPVTMLDWQATKMGPPALDAAIFLGSCVMPDQRRASERDLLKSYREGLAARGIDGFGDEDIWESYRRSALYLFLLGVSVSVTLQQTERGDRMWISLIERSGELVADTDAARVLD